MTIQWSEEAVDDIGSLHAFIARDNPAAARKMALALVEAVETLLPGNPHIGRPGRVNGTRELVVPHTPYVVPYRLKGGIIQILRVYHGASTRKPGHSLILWYNVVYDKAVGTRYRESARSARRAAG